MNLSKLTNKQFHAQVEKICLSFGGIKDKFDHFIIPTPKYGEISVKPINDWIALRFVIYSTGIVYDSLFGRNFNGYSGKWNILLSGDIYEVRKNSLQELERRLNLLFDKTEN